MNHSPIILASPDALKSPQHLFDRLAAFFKVAGGGKADISAVASGRIMIQARGLGGGFPAEMAVIENLIQEMTLYPAEYPYTISDQAVTRLIKQLHEYATYLMTPEFNDTLDAAVVSDHPTVKKYPFMTKALAIDFSAMTNTLQATVCIGVIVGADPVRDVGLFAIDESTIAFGFRK